MHAVVAGGCFRAFRLAGATATASVAFLFWDEVDAQDDQGCCHSAMEDQWSSKERIGPSGLPHIGIESFKSS